MQQQPERRLEAGVEPRGYRVSDADREQVAHPLRQAAVKRKPARRQA